MISHKRFRPPASFIIEGHATFPLVFRLETVFRIVRRSIHKKMYSSQSNRKLLFVVIVFFTPSLQITSKTYMQLLSCMFFIT